MWRLRILYWCLLSTMAAATIPAILTLAGCKSDELVCSWASDPISTDGKISDWLDKPVTFLDERDVTIGICNDADYLYLHFRTQDQKLAQLIGASGLNLYLDRNGGTNKEFLIRFKAFPRVQQPHMSDGRRSPEYSSFPRLPSDTNQLPQLSCSIENRIVEKPIPLDGSEGPIAAYDTSHGFHAYEFAIPLQFGGVRFYGIGAEPGQKVGLGVGWGDLQGKWDGTHRLPEGLTGGSGPGRPPGGSRGGDGFGGGSGGGKKTLPQKQEVWFKVVLALPSEVQAASKEII